MQNLQVNEQRNKSREVFTFTKQHSKSKKATITFKPWEIDLFIEFSESLLNKKNPRQKQGTYFKKSNKMPSDVIYLKSFLLARYQYDEPKPLIEKYNFILDEFYKLSINQFYNLFKYLKINNILVLNSDSLFRVLDKSNTIKNNLKEKDTINKNSDFLTIIL